MKALPQINRWKSSVLVSVLVSLFSWLPGADAAELVQLDFGIAAPTAGMISFGGGSAPLVGSGIEVDSVVGLSTPANANVTALCISCQLNFTTGAHTAYGVGAYPWWNFDSGGTITITGGLQFQGAPDIPTGSILLEGAFNGAKVVDFGGSTGFKITGASFFDTKHAELLSYFGLGFNTVFEGNFNISFNANAGPGGAFTSSNVLSGNVVNTVPLPAAAWLFGSGLTALVASRVKTPVA